MENSLYMYGDVETSEFHDSTDDSGGTINSHVLASTQRRMGEPRDDIERAMNHYNISMDEYFANPQLYPLPERGTGLSADYPTFTGGTLLHPEYLPPQRTAWIQGETLGIPKIVFGLGVGAVLLILAKKMK
jgi:hypothetical protein